MAADSPTLAVSELFYSIQGESTFAGLPCLFIRLAGCNLRCNYCDARYTYEEKGDEKTIATLLSFVDATPGLPVEITGGEPLLQPDTILLMRELLPRGRTVLLETNGSLPLSAVPAEVIKIVDVKCPDSGMHNHLLLENLAALQPHDELKFVLSSRRDYDYAVSFIETHRLLGRKLLFSPVTGRLQPAELASWLLADRLAVRLQLQLHKILWPDEKRGV